MNDLDTLSASIQSGKPGMVLAAADDDDDSDIQELAAQNGQQDYHTGEDDEQSVYSDNVGDDDDNQDDDQDDDKVEDDGSEMGEEDIEDENDEEVQEDNGQYYRPNVGEDIYGRSTTGETKYIPPAQRAAALRIDETSDSYILLKVSNNITWHGKTRKTCILIFPACCFVVVVVAILHLCTSDESMV